MLCLFMIDPVGPVVGETGVGCHTGWLSHCQYLIRWMAVPCGDLHVTCALQTEPHNVQTLAADRIFRLLQVHITFRVTFVIFVVIVAYDVAIVLRQICINSPVHRIKQKISERFGTTIRYANGVIEKITIFLQCCHGAGCHMRLGDGCHCVEVCRTTRTEFFSVGVCIFSVDFAMHVSL